MIVQPRDSVTVQFREVFSGQPTTLPAQFIAAFSQLFPLEHHHNRLVVAGDVLRNRQGLPIG